jgi:hypothetical protein
VQRRWKLQLIMLTKADDDFPPRLHALRRCDEGLAT